MKRFTVKELRIVLDQNKANQKLSDLEDIEEELGVDLITLFKALRNGIYIKDRYIVYEACPEIVGDENCFYYSDRDSYVHFKDYGKTWALTEEELENATNDETK